MDETTTALEAKIQQLLELPAIDLDAPCTFECQGCGWRCCSDRNDIIATPYSLLRITWGMQTLAENYPQWSQALGVLLASAIVIEQGCSSLMPLAAVDFKPTGSGHTICPFLVPADTIPNNGMPLLIRALRASKRGQDLSQAPLSVCGIYDVRPNMCRLFPLGRVGTPGESGETEWMYVLQDVSCGRHGPRTDGLTWGEWIDTDTQEQNGEGLDLYIAMAEMVRQRLARAGVQADAWLNDGRNQAVLRFAFYGFPAVVVPSPEQRTHETAMAICQASADLLPQVVDGLLQGTAPDPEKLFAALQAALSQPLAD